MTAVRCALVCVAAVLLAEIADAKNFRYGAISWSTCRNEKDKYMVFYDPLFPEVCKLCTSPLCIGVTTNVAFKLSGSAVSPFLEKLAEDVAAFRRNPDQVLSLLALLVQKCKY